MQTKRCNRCGITKDASAFYRTSRGHLRSMCKPCLLAYNATHHLGIDVEPSDVEAIRKANRERMREYIKGNASMYQRSRRYMARYPERRRAWKAVERAVARGRLTRPDRCACGRAMPVIAHHDDYTRPLDVAWLCHACHRARHEELAREAVSA